MRYLILILIFSSSFAFSIEEALLEEFVEYGARVNSMESAEEKQKMECVLSLVFYHLDEEEMVYFRNALEHSKAHPHLNDHEVGEEAQKYYDYSGKMKVIIQGKVDILKEDIEKCFVGE